MAKKELKRVIVLVDEKLHSKIKKDALKNKKSMSKYVYTALMEKYYGVHEQSELVNK